MKHKLILSVAIYALTNLPPFGGREGSCQNIGINTTGAVPDASALLDIDAAPGGNKGLLIPRVSLTSTTDVVTIPSPATSLLVYNTNAAMTAGGIGYWYWDGSKWVALLNNASANNQGAWLLNGNTLTGTLPATPNEWLGTINSADWILKTDNTERMRVRSTGNIGIGNSTSNYPLYVTKTYTATTGNLYGTMSDMTFDPSATNTTNNVSFGGSTVVPSSNSQNFTGNLYAGFGNVEFFGSGTASNTYAIQGKTNNRAGGTITLARGLYSEVNNIGAGTISSGIGLHIKDPQNSGGGTYTNFYGIYIGHL